MAVEPVSAIESRYAVHCDLKCENVRLTADRQRAVLVDWGMARRIDKQSPMITQGTPLYASPEQLTGYDIDQAWGRARLGPPCDVCFPRSQSFFLRLASPSPPPGQSPHDAPASLWNVPTPLFAGLGAWNLPLRDGLW